MNLGYLASLAKLESGEDCTDKGMLDHKFVEIYEKFFFQWINEPIKILEIGICSGGSLKLWYDYFKKASIFGIDIEPKTKLDNDRIKTFLGNQSDRNSLQKFIDNYEGEFDIIIDDGGHSMEQQQVSFGFLFPFIKSGGYYVIEDLHTSIYSLHNEFQATANTSTLLMVEDIINRSNIKSGWMSDSEKAYLQDNIDFMNLNSRIRNGNGRSITCLIKKK